MFTDLDFNVDCFTTDAPPTTLYANVHLGVALESKSCNYPFPFLFLLFDRCGGLMSPQLRSVIHLGSYGSSRLGVSLRAPHASSDEDIAITECQQQRFVVDWSAQALLRLSSGHPQSRGVPFRWLPSTVICFSDTSDC